VKRDDGLPRSAEACLEKVKASPEKMKAGLEEMVAMVETGLEAK
jgi:hypothetical protein